MYQVILILAIERNVLTYCITTGNEFPFSQDCLYWNTRYYDSFYYRSINSVLARYLYQHVLGNPALLSLPVERVAEKGVPGARHPSS